MSEVPWEKILVCELSAPEIVTVRKCRCGNKNCQTAKRIRCVCGCHAENHGIKNREHMPKLDKLLELDGLDVFPAELPTPEELSVW